jgi:outer membrane murein-binding lipoprotein Lpp
MPRTVLAIIAAIAASLALAGCASGSFLGLATSAHVDEQFATSTAERDAALQALEGTLSGELSSLQVDVQRVDELTRELEILLATIRENERATQELQQLATVVASRLEELPTETLRRLVEILQGSLGEQEAP